MDENKLVARLAEAVALKCGLHPNTAKKLRTAAVLHDCGKQKICDTIINKPGKLSKQKFEIIKTHTVLGAELLKDIQGDLGEMARQIALYHHEKYSGDGYWGKYTDELPVYVPITAICDVFVALIHQRPYKHAWPIFEALEYIQEQAGYHFSPVLVGVFIPLIQTDYSVLLEGV